MPWKECQPRHSRQGGALLILAIKNALKMFTSENVLCRKRQLQLTAPYTPSPLRETSTQNQTNIIKKQN